MIYAKNTPTNTTIHTHTPTNKHTHTQTNTYTQTIHQQKVIKHTWYIETQKQAQIHTQTNTADSKITHIQTHYNIFLEMPR